MSTCTPNKHNLDVMHLGCCTNCGGNKIVDAERLAPPEDDELKKVYSEIEQARSTIWKMKDQPVIVIAEIDDILKAIIPNQ